MVFVCNEEQSDVGVLRAADEVGREAAVEVLLGAPIVGIGGILLDDMAVGEGLRLLSSLNRLILR